MRSTSYELRVAPVIEQPEMVLFRPENPDFAFPAGRYALVLKGQAFDFTVSGPILKPPIVWSAPKRRMARFIPNAVIHRIGGALPHVSVPERNNQTRCSRQLPPTVRSFEHSASAASRLLASMRTRCQFSPSMPD